MTVAVCCWCDGGGFDGRVLVLLRPFVLFTFECVDGGPVPGWKLTSLRGRNMPVSTIFKPARADGEVFGSALGMIRTCLEHAQQGQRTAAEKNDTTRSPCLTGVHSGLPFNSVLSGWMQKSGTDAHWSATPHMQTVDCT